jgi:hypothetical protein
MKILKVVPAWLLILGAVGAYWLYDQIRRNKLATNNPIA